MRSLQRCETTPSSDEGRKQVSKGALTTTRNSFPLQELNVATKFMLFFYSDNVTRDTNIKGDPKQNEEITFQFGSHEVLQLYASCDTRRPDSNFVTIQYSFGWKNPFAFPPKDCTLLHVDLLSRYDVITGFRTNSEVMRF